MHYLLLVHLANLVFASPLPTDFTATDFFYPATNVASIKAIHSSNMVEIPVKDSLKLAHANLAKELGVDIQNLKLTFQFTDSNDVTHAHYVRLINSIPVANHNAAVHIMNGVVSSFSASFTNKKQTRKATGTDIADSKVSVSLVDAVKIAESSLKAAKYESEPTLGYVQVKGGDLVYAHQFQLRDVKTKKWLGVSVDAKTVDYVNRASYKAIPFQSVNPTVGFTMQIDPEDPIASPNGWNVVGDSGFQETIGNNVDVFVKDGKGFASVFYGRAKGLKNSVFGISATDAKHNTFDSNWDPNVDTRAPANKRASSINLFYLVNRMHDWAYRYGFTEVAGNFQTENFGKGGKGKDAVLASDLDPSSSDNAYFATPPDGQAPTMDMFSFDQTEIKRDGALDIMIPIHEYTHGISNRLTGGAANAQCLQSVESRGLGEGWGDAIALYLTRTPKSFAEEIVYASAYVIDNPTGIRHRPYTTRMDLNPYLYSHIAKYPESHDMGEIFTAFLYDMYWNLVTAFGFNADIMDNTSRSGSNVAMQLLIGGMMFQPCNPTFIEARNAILTADDHYYKSSHRCFIWKAFARRGMGVFALDYANVPVDEYSLPPGC